MIIPTLLHIVLRLLFRRSSLPPSKGSLAIYVITYLPTFLLIRYLKKIGTTRRDAAGTLISSGEDLSQPGVTEWCFDIIYVTCEFTQCVKGVPLTYTCVGVCQVGSGALGEWFWYFWLVVSPFPRSFSSFY
jgi:hypothetical protein